MTFSVPSPSSRPLLDFAGLETSQKKILGNYNLPKFMLQWYPNEVICGIALPI